MQSILQFLDTQDRILILINLVTITNEICNILYISLDILDNKLINHKFHYNPS